MLSPTAPHTAPPKKFNKLSALKLTWQSYSLILLFLIAGLLRVINLQAPGGLVEREFNSAITARNFYFKNNPEIEPWRQIMAQSLKEKQFILEPPLTEFLVSIVYRIVGQEEIWYARPVTSAFWLIGGIFMYLLARKVLSAGGAIIATGYYLFVPSGVLISRSFQPDALMMLLFLASLYCIFTYFERPSLPGLLLAASLSGLTILLRPLVLFALYGAFFSLSIYQNRMLQGFSGRHFITFFLVSLLLPGIYYGNGIFISGFLQGQADISFRPYLLRMREFWEGWFFLGTNTVGFTALLAALPGFWLIQKGLSRALIIGLGTGYIIFGLFFTYHISTHPYYHVQIIPLIGICIVPLISQILVSLRERDERYWWLPVLAATVVMCVFAYKQISENLWSQVFESPGTAREIGEIVKHSDRSVFVAHHYGLPLEYYGEFTGNFWPRKMDYWLVPQPGEKERTVQERLDALGFIPEYFIITHFKDYAVHHQDLKAYLVENCSLLAQTEQYLIYDKCLQ